MTRLYDPFSDPWFIGPFTYLLFLAFLLILLDPADLFPVTWEAP